MLKKNIASPILLGAFVLFLSVFLLPVCAKADGAETVVRPDGDGVENPAASIELVDPEADSMFYVYSFDGDSSLLSFPSDNYYDTEHTVYVKVTGENPTEPCDDRIVFYSGNECDVKTVKQGIKSEDEVDENGNHYSIWYCTVTQGGYDGPAPYTVIASSGATAGFFPRAVTFTSKLTLNYSQYTMQPGRVVSLTASRLVEGGEWEWFSSDPSVATVNSSGVVTAIADGTADITIHYEGYGLSLSAVCKVTVGSGQKAPVSDGAEQTPAPSGSGIQQPGTESQTSSSGVNESSVSQGGQYLAGSGKTKAIYKVLNTSTRTVSYATCKSSKKNVTVPATVTLGDGKTYTVTKIEKKAFASSKKVKTVTIRTKKLTKASVKKCLKGSKVTTVKTVRANAYKKFFTKANCGKAVKITK